MNLFYYNYLIQIDKLFNSNIFTCIISNKLSTEDYMQKIIYKKNINNEEKYIINIITNYIIKVTIPIKKSNYLYTCYFSDIEDVYYYLIKHV